LSKANRTENEKYLLPAFLRRKTGDEFRGFFMMRRYEANNRAVIGAVRRPFIL
jgi:hypothetical protein